MYRPLGIVALIAIAPACDKPVAGKDDVLTFRYDVEDQLFPAALTSPVAATLHVDIEVFGRDGSEDPATVFAATSMNPAIAEVVSTEGNRVTLRAVDRGQVEIAVRTSHGDDAFDIDVAPIARVDLMAPGYLVSESPQSKVLAGGTARFFASLYNEVGRKLVGYGPLAITADPPESATIPSSTDIGMVPITFHSEGTVSLQAVGDAPLLVEVVPQSELTEFSFKGIATADTVVVGKTLHGVLRGVTEDGSVVSGVASLATVRATTDHCQIALNPSLGEGVYVVTGLSAGACRIETSLGDVVGAFEVEVVPN